MRISVLTGACFKRDAISEVTHRTVVELINRLGAEVRLYAYSNEFSEIDAKICHGVEDVLTDDFINSSDILLYQFGIFYDMFKLLAIGAGRAKQLVYFHNVTPKALMPSHAQGLIDRSLDQVALIDEADYVMATSAFNRTDLVARGVPPARIGLLPLYVKCAEPQLGRKPRATPFPLTPSPVRLLYVGRFVQLKGVIGLIMAAGRLMRHGGFPFTMTLAGSAALSDQEYLAEMRGRIVAEGLLDQVCIETDVTDDRLRHLYAEADIFVMPSHHEGFCLPVLEALHAGCVPVATVAGNLPSLVGEAGLLYSPGDVDALTRALVGLGAQFVGGRPDILNLADRCMSWAQFEAEAAACVAAHAPERFGEKLAKAVADLADDPRPPRTARLRPQFGHLRPRATAMGLKDN